MVTHGYNGLRNYWWKHYGLRNYWEYDGLRECS